MFGPEASGLSNEEISYSNCTVQIPTQKKFTSINLSHSVILVSFEIFKIFGFKKSIKNTIFKKTSSKKKN